VWSVNGFVGGAGATGAVTSLGVYSPSPTIFAGHSVTIKATTTDSPSSSGSITVKILNPLPMPAAGVIIPATLGGSYLLDVTGSGFVPASQLQFAGVTIKTLFISSGELGATINLATGTSSVTVGVLNPDANQKTPASLLVRVNTGAFRNSTGTIAVNATATAAARFLDQTSFGPTATSIAHVQQIGLQRALTEQFSQPTTVFSEPPNPDPECSSSSNWRCTQSEFLSVTAWGNDQLRQRVAMALSELWVAPTETNNAMPFYTNMLANDAFANYRTIMQDVTLSPQMGAYLDMLNSGKPAPRQIANENYARELMQLFSLGLNLLNPDGTQKLDSGGNPIPSYTELQVEAFARAYTGWTNANTDGSAPSSFNYAHNWLFPMAPVGAAHDTTEKLLLGDTILPAGQTAEEDLKGALDNIFAQPNVGPFVCRQLIQHMVTGNPSPGYVQRVAEAFDDNGQGVRGDMKAVLTAIIMDAEARAGDTQTGDEAESNPAVDGGHLREPLLWMVNLVRGLNGTKTNPADQYPFVSLMAINLGTLGEEPFNQSSVFNYFSPQFIIPQTSINAPEFQLEDTRAIIPRLNLANTIIHSAAPGLTIDLSATSTIGQHAADPSGLADYLGTLFMHSQMPSGMRSELITTVSAIPATDPLRRAQVAVYLVVTSSQYKIIH
jgi:uncharacterized protein (DUF1800 family)